MPKKLSDEEYFRSLPRKIAGTAVMLFDAAGKLLIVKPDYRKEWLLPGGTVDADESPYAGALRETLEEVGLVLPALTLVGVYSDSGHGIQPASIKFIFAGGILPDEQIASIRLQEAELEEYRFLPVEEALALLSNSLKLSIPACIAAHRKGVVSFIEAEL